ncbi:A24 family peptidase [uncultured Cedecea sp.]|uniref:prepilin peptidase n=1 Tax=uncultured Cedecea sp. TaxID=988762 RepID=UPI00260BA062|nr:A24 family peptidase [uncultured Cedecea sp.]
MIPETLNGTLLVGTLFYFSFATCLAITDYRTGLLPDKLTLPLLWLGLIFHTWTNSDKLTDAIYGAVCGYLALWLLFWCFFCLSKREGLGYGDFKLLAAIGAWNGWQSLPLVLIIASTTGIVACMVLRIIQKKWPAQLPFGPCLAAAGCGEFIWQI